MIQTTSCEQCGGTTDSKSLHGLCGRCLATVAFASESPEKWEGPLPFEAGASLNETLVVDMAASLPRVEPMHRFGDYELIHEIARGGMGVVYKARQISLNRSVAVKMILHARFNNREFVRRFRAEAEAAANLRHPNIVGIYEIGEEDGQHYFSMEYIEGRDLASFINEKPLPPQRAAQHLKTIAEAIHYAHQHGILHRDLKPSNVLVDLNGEVHITDFGLAKRVPGTEGSSLGSGLGSTGLGDASELDITVSGQVLGSPNYMSPEQAAGKNRDVDARSDVYALGAILYSLLTGRPPFVAASIEAILTQVLHVEAPSLRLVNPTVPRDLETVALKCLQKDPARRYGSAQEVAEELGRFLRGESIHARPVSAPEKVWRWCKRKPVVAGLGVSTILLLVAVAIGSPVAIYRIERARQAAETNSQLAQASEKAAQAHLAAERRTHYATEMLFAAEEIQDDNRGQAMELLKNSRPQPGQPDFRGWEWRFLWAQCRSDELFTVGTHPKEIYRVAFLPDGRLACGDFDKSVKIWDPKTRTVLASETAGSCSDLEISPDGSIIGLATWSSDFTFLDATNLTRKGSARFRNKVYHLAFSPRDKLFATAGPDHVALWSFTLPKPSLVWTQEIRGVTGLAFAPDGGTFAFATREPRVYVYETATRTLRTSMGARVQPAEVVFSPDGARLAVSHWNGTVAIYDPATGAEITALTKHTKWVASLAFSRSDPILATSSADERIQLWDTRTWKETTSLKGHLSLVDSVAVSPDGRWLASGSKDRTVRIWDLKTKEAGDSRNLTDVSQGSAVSPKAEFLAVVNGDGTISIWDLFARRETGRFPVETNTTVIATSPKGTAVVLRNISSDKVWMHRIDATDSTIQIEGAKPDGSRAAFSPDGKLFAVGGTEQAEHLLHIGATDGSRSVRVPKHRVESTSEILFSHDGRQIFTANQSGKLRVYDTASGEIAWELAAHNVAVNGIALDPDGLRLATSSLDETVGLWDLTTRRKLGSYGKSTIGYRCVTFSRDGKRIAASAGESLVQVWDVASKREVARFKKTERVFTVRFAADDRTLVITTDRELSLYRAPTFEEILAAEAKRQ